MVVPSSLLRLRKARKRWLLVGMVQIYHIIPQCLGSHPAMMNVEIHCSDNLMCMPTFFGSATMNLRPGRLMMEDISTTTNIFFE